MVVLHSEIKKALAQPGSLVRLTGSPLEWPVDISFRSSNQEVRHACRGRRLIIVGTTLGDDYVETPTAVLEDCMLIIMRNHVDGTRYGISLLQFSLHFDESNTIHHVVGVAALPPSPAIIII